jgi:DNA-binding CsgD family transcriptional regulator
VERTLPAINDLVRGDVVCHAEVEPIETKLASQTTFADNDTPPYIRDAFERLMLTSPIFQYWMASGDVSAIRTSDFLSRRQWHDMALYREVYRQWGTEDSLAIGLPAPPGLVACFCIERSSPFSDRERLLLDLARPHLSFAYRNAEALSMLASANAREGTHSVLLDARGRIVQASSEALELLSRSFPGEQVQLPSLPRSLDDWVRRHVTQLDEDIPPPNSPYSARTLDGARVTIRMLKGDTTGAQILLVLRENRDRSPTSLDKHGLSAREKEVLGEALRGLSSKEIAASLVISQRTVEKHLESIYNKLGVDSRAAAIAMVLQR